MKEIEVKTTISDVGIFKEKFEKLGCFNYLNLVMTPRMLDNNQ